MSLSKPRIEWIDQARGWGMVLVMLGHAPFATIPHDLIYSFHIPFFFALSGWLHNPSKHATFPEIVKARWKNLILPYFLYSAIGYAALALQWMGGHKPWGLEPLDPLWGTLMGIRNSTPYNGTLWFVACLVVTEFAYHWIYRLSGKNAWRPLFVSVIPLVYFLWFRLALPFAYPWSSDAAFIALLFFSFGHFAKSQSDSGWYKKLSGHWAWLVLAAWLVVALLEGKVDMYTVRYDSPALFVLGAFLGILAAFLLAPRFPKMGWVAFVGRHSLVYLALHEWLAFGFVRIVQNHFLPGGLPASQWALAGLGIGYALFALLVLWPVCLVFDRWVPVLVGGGRK